MSLTGLVSRLFGRRDKPINVVAPVDAAKGQYVLTDSFRLKFRPAQDLPPSLRDELLNICRNDPRVSACYLLDVLEQPTGDFKFFVDLRLDNPAALHDLGPRMQQVLRRYPHYADRFFVGADAIAGVTEEQAAYQRGTAHAE